LYTAAAGGDLPVDHIYELLGDKRLLKLAALRRTTEICNRHPRNAVLLRLKRDAKRLRGRQEGFASCINSIRVGLQRHDYRWSVPTPIRAGKRRIWIRPLKDQILEQAIVLLLGPIVEPHLHEQNFGWRKGRSALQAKQIIEDALLYGDFDYVIRTDIERCFETIPHGGLIKSLQNLISDEQFVTLIKDLITVKAVKRNAGILQGTVSAPILANMFLNGLDSRVLTLGTILGPATLQESSVQAKRRFTVGPVVPTFVRYCDDIVVLVEGDWAQAQHVKAQIANWLGGHGMKLNDMKDHIGPVDEPFDFVSFTLCRINDPDPAVLLDISEARRKRLAGDLKSRLRESSDRKYRKRVKKQFRRQQGAYFKAGGVPLDNGFLSAVEASLPNQPRT
jgi:hypothetical protein